MKLVNIEDQITYVTLKDLKNQPKTNQTVFQRVLKRVNQLDPKSSHIVADTLRLIDIDHNQFLNCRINLKQKVHPVPDTSVGSGSEWVTNLGKLELKRLIFDYQK